MSSHRGLDFLWTVTWVRHSLPGHSATGLILRELDLSCSETHILHEWAYVCVVWSVMQVMRSASVWHAGGYSCSGFDELHFHGSFTHSLIHFWGYIGGSNSCCSWWWSLHNLRIYAINLTYSFGHTARFLHQSALVVIWHGYFAQKSVSEWGEKTWSDCSHSLSNMFKCLKPTLDSG